jgi:hypothetical protein
MRKLLLAACFAPLLHSADIQGTVVENMTGHPLARASVTLTPVAGSPGAPATIRTTLYGAFSFTQLPAGAYLVSAARQGFATIQFGQKHFKSAGLPVILDESQSTQIEIRLPRMGAIAGRILDENDVGLPEHDLVVYRIAKPPILAGHTITDDRGVYRVGGLEPGAYFVRTTARIYEDGGYLPTFFHDVTSIDQAQTLDVTLDQQVDDVSIRPKPGILLRLGGFATCPRMADEQMAITLVSDMGKQTVTADSNTGKFQFPPQSPGKYELNLAGSGAPIPCFGYQEIDLDRNLTEQRISGVGLPPVRLLFEDTRGARVDPHQLQVMARRKELSGPGEIQKLNAAADPLPLAPGRWEFAIAPSSSSYMTRFFVNGNPASDRADGWNEALIVSGSGYRTLKFVLSSSPGAVHGMVTLGSQQAIGAPVFLENSDLEPARRYHEPLMVRTDSHGQFRFSGLAPGDYRLFSTFEFQNPSAAEFDSAGATHIKIEETRDFQQDLTLFVLR